MATINKRLTKAGKPYYTVQIRLKGHPPQTASFDRLTDARKWAASIESAIREGRHFKTNEAKKHTLDELIAHVIAEVLPGKKPQLRSDQTTQLNWFKAELGYCLLSSVTPSMLASCRDKLLKEEGKRGKVRSPSSVTRFMAALSHAFTIGVNDLGWLDNNPMLKVKKPKEPRGRVRFLGDTERDRLLIACKESSNKQLYLCVVLALSTGMRQAELMCLTWQDVNLKDGFLILHETKNGERRRVPVHGRALSLLNEHAKVRRLDTPLLFPSHKDSQKTINLRRPFENALKAAEINDFHWHDLRHCTASYLAMNGASSAEIAEVLGHKTLQMVKRYSHLSDAHISGVVASMNEKIFGGSHE